MQHYENCSIEYESFEYMMMAGEHEILAFAPSIEAFNLFDAYSSRVLTSLLCERKADPIWSEESEIEVHVHMLLTIE